MSTITFESMPKAIADLHDKVDAILKAMTENTVPETDKLLTMEELIDFIPEHPARQTIYGWINNKLIPYQKHGKRCYFRKSTIKQWLDNGRKIV